MIATLWIIGGLAYAGLLAGVWGMCIASSRRDELEKDALGKARWRRKKAA